MTQPTLPPTPTPRYKLGDIAYAGISEKRPFTIVGMHLFGYGDNADSPEWDYDLASWVAVADGGFWSMWGPEKESELIKREQRMQEG